ncbi:hypothetical protein BDW71DRAFT_202256 [Aspergillus fruticulosus]
MVNWKDADNRYRLVAALIATNPGIKFEYHAIAAIFGKGATRDSIQHQIRSIKATAEKIKAEAAKNGVDVSNLASVRSTAPITSRSRVTKPSGTPSTGKGKKSAIKGFTTPTQSGSRKSAANSLMGAIFVDSDKDEPGADENDADGAKVKTENADAGIIHSIEGDDGHVVGVVVPVKQEDVFSTSAGREKPSSTSDVRGHTSAGPPVSDDEYMESPGASPTPQVRQAHSRTRPSRASAVPGGAYVDKMNSTDEETA